MEDHIRHERDPQSPGDGLAGALSADTDERLQFALAAAGMGVFEWDVKSDVLTWSSTTGLGLGPEAAPTSGQAFLELVHPDDRTPLRETRALALRTCTDAVSEFRILLPDGKVHWIQAHGRVVCDADGKPSRVLGINADITHRKSLQEQLREANVEVARLNVLKATMRTVQDIVNNALQGLQIFRLDAEGYVSPVSLEQFDHIIADTAAKLKALGDLETVVETGMSLGAGIEYQRKPKIERQ